ncbi:MAG TPA: OadG family protein [Longimicrobiales bacterium]|nr:OadG family protein [Longimicrobiales bacterium]
MSIDNVLTGHGLGIAVTGMTVVFAGLVLVSLYIRVLPRVLEEAGGLARRRRDRQATDSTVVPAALSSADPALLAAIGYVLQAEREHALALDDQRITLREDDEEQRVWTAIGKMRTLATRM